MSTYEVIIKKYRGIKVEASSEKEAMEKARETIGMDEEIDSIEWLED